MGKPHIHVLSDYNYIHMYVWYRLNIRYVNCVFKVYKRTISSRRPPDMDKMSVKVSTDGKHMIQVDCMLEVKTGDVCSS